MDLLKDVSMEIAAIHDAGNNELVRENLRKILARNAVKRGVRWIEKHADTRGWWRNCLNGGKSRVRSGYTSEGILELVFEYRPEFADNTHYINGRKIADHFKLSYRKLIMLGIYAYGGWLPFPDRYPSIVISNKELDRAWAEFLENPPGDWRLPAKHWKSELDYWDEPERNGSFFKRLIRWVGTTLVLAST